MQRKRNEQKCCLVIFVSSVSRRFGLVARFAYAIKKKHKKLKTLRPLNETKQVGGVF